MTLEVIVVDNASTDGAADMVAREFPQVRLVRNATNAGFSKANNQAAALAQGRFLFFLNNDTVVPPGTLRRLVDCLTSRPRTILMGPRLRDGAGNVQVSHRRRPTVSTFLHRTLLLRWTGLFRGEYHSYRRQEMSETTPCPVDVLMGAALFCRREDFVRLGGWDEDFTFGGEDMELCHRAQAFGEVVYAPQIEITHFGRASTRENLAFASIRIAEGFARYFRKSGASRGQMLLYKLAVTVDAPVQIAVKGMQFLTRRLLGKRKQADQSWGTVRGAVYLLKGIVRFWTA